MKKVTREFLTEKQIKDAVKLLKKYESHPSLVITSKKKFPFIEIEWCYIL